MINYLQIKFKVNSYDSIPFAPFLYDFHQLFIFKSAFALFGIFKTLKQHQHDIAKIYNKQKLQTKSLNKLNVKESNNFAGMLHDAYLIVILFLNTTQ